MNAIAAYPDTPRLAEAARHNHCVPCHLCGGHAPSADCAACLGSGWLRPCLACLALGAETGAVGLARICLVCGGRRHTAGSAPSPDDDLRRSDIRAWPVRHSAQRSGYGEFS